MASWAPCALSAFLSATERPGSVLFWSPFISPSPCPTFSLFRGSPVFRIGRVPPSLFLAGKTSHRSAVSLDGPPTFRRPTWPGLYRHHLIGFVGIVGYHFPFAFSPALQPTGVRLNLTGYFRGKSLSVDLSRRFALPSALFKWPTSSPDSL